MVFCTKAAAGILHKKLLLTFYTKRYGTNFMRNNQATVITKFNPKTMISIKFYLTKFNFVCERTIYADGVVARPV